MSSETPGGGNGEGSSAAAPAAATSALHRNCSHPSGRRAGPRALDRPEGRRPGPQVQDHRVGLRLLRGWSWGKRGAEPGQDLPVTAAGPVCPAQDRPLTLSLCRQPGLESPSMGSASTARTRRWCPWPKSSSKTGSGCWVRGGNFDFGRVFLPVPGRGPCLAYSRHSVCVS